MYGRMYDTKNVALGTYKYVDHFWCTSECEYNLYGS